MSTHHRSRDPFRILIINPNVSEKMTEALKPVLERLDYHDVHWQYYTSPKQIPSSGPSNPEMPIESINNAVDSAKTAWICREVANEMEKYDAFLVACYSAHPLVGIIREKIEEFEQNNPTQKHRYVTGIFEASITTALSLTSGFNLTTVMYERKQVADSFGIVTTGNAWKEELANAVTEMLAGVDQNYPACFAGVETTGLSAIELHKTDPEEVTKRICEATERLLRNYKSFVGAVCLGCAGMAGMEKAVREGCILAYGQKDGNRVRIVDGVVAGAAQLVSYCRQGF